MDFVYSFYPYALPDSRRTGVEDTFRIFFPILLSSGNLKIVRLIRYLQNNHVFFFPQSTRNIHFEAHVASDMLRDKYIVYP